MSVKTQIFAAWKAAPFKNYIYMSIGLNVLTIVIILLFKGLIPPVVPFFYGKPVGDGQLIPALGLLIAPLASLFITTLNLGLSSMTSDNFLKKVYAASTLLFTLLTTITVIKIIFLVGFF